MVATGEQKKGRGSRSGPRAWGAVEYGGLERRQQAAMRAYIEDCNSRGRADVLQRSPRRERAGDMPRIRKSDASRRTMGEFLDGDGVRRMLKSRGITKAEARAALTDELKARGMRPSDFKMLSRSSQNKIMAVTSSKARKGETRSYAARALIGDVETPEAMAVLEDAKLLDSFGAKRRASVAASIEDAAKSGDMSRRNAAALFVGTLKDRARFERSGSVETPTYDPASRTVLIPKGQDPFNKVIAHEVIHLIDHQGTVLHGDGSNRRTRTTQYSSHSYVSANGRISNLLAEGCRALLAKVEGTDAQTYALMLARERGLELTYEGIGFLSDLIDAASRGRWNLGFGHSLSDEGHWARGSGQTVAAESLANYGESAVGNAVEFDLIREMFPRTARGLDELIEVMANGV